MDYLLLEKTRAKKTELLCLKEMNILPVEYSLKVSKR